MSYSLWSQGLRARQSPISMRFPQQEYWSELPCPSPGDLPDPGIEPGSPALTGGFFTTKPLGKPVFLIARRQIVNTELRDSQVVLVVKNLPASAGDTGDGVSKPGSGRSPGEGHGYPRQYSPMANPVDRGAWWATVHGATQSQTWQSTHTYHLAKCLKTNSEVTNILKHTC